MAHENPLKQLEAYGQSIWLDFLRRGMLVSGQLRQFIEQDGVSGMTSNPTIFEKAIDGSHDYDDALHQLLMAGKTSQEIYEMLTVDDIRMAADIFRPTYDRTHGEDGFISLEVSPHLAHDTEGTIREAHRLWHEVDRPNVMIKVPATSAGIPTIRQLTSDGVNVNITLLFGLPRYHEVAEAYIAGQQARMEKGLPLHHIASVASFFLSRIDVLVDPLLEQEMRNPMRADIAASCHGQVAITCAKLAYQRYLELFGEAFHELANHGARTQRLLWASTSTKNPTFSDVKYIEPLIGPHTINTVPLETLDAYRDHGKPALSLPQHVDKAEHVLGALIELGIDLDQITQQLEDEGVKKFITPYDKLLKTLDEKRDTLLKRTPLDRQQMALGEAQEDVTVRLQFMQQEHFSHRFWQKDPTVWSTDIAAHDSIRNGLGWLHVAEKMEGNLPVLQEFASDVRNQGFTHVLHMGMGGSSLAPLVFQRTFGVGEQGLPLTVLDTTDPATLRQLTTSLPLANTLFIVASKSGTTAEPIAFFDYFYAQLQQLKGDAAGENFVAITDPGTPLERMAREKHFRHVFLNYPDIGGRYSALSYFGMVPATLLGLDVNELLRRALSMAYACAPYLPEAQNPGIVLGTVMGMLAARGVNKVTFLTPASLASLGLWLEQLLAESTGKEAVGLLPVAGEPLGKPEVYSTDRIFIHFTLDHEHDASLDELVEQLRKAGHPVVTIHLTDRLDLGQEFFRWEIATATAGALLGINAFNQPNVQESKDNTNRLLDEIVNQGKLSAESPAAGEGPLHLYGYPAPNGSLEQALRQLLSSVRAEDYLAVTAYLTETAEMTQALDALRALLLSAIRVPVTLGYGPRYLHSTGQFHKGGPNEGVFLQLTSTVTQDVALPGRPYTFGMFRQAQARGDLQAVQHHQRRVTRIDLGDDAAAGLRALHALFQRVLEGWGQQRAA